MKVEKLAGLTMAGVLVAMSAIGACDDGGGDGSDDGADDPGDGSDGSGGADAAPGTPDGAPDTPDGAPPAADAAPDVACTGLPMTLNGAGGGSGFTPYGTICFNPGGQPQAAECEVTTQVDDDVSTYCNQGGVVLARDNGPASNGVVILKFGAATMIIAHDGGTPSGSNPLEIQSIPNGAFTIDFKGDFGTGTASAIEYRAAVTFNLDGTVTVNSMGPKP